MNGLVKLKIFAKSFLFLQIIEIIAPLPCALQTQEETRGAKLCAGDNAR